jgi:hypothetical protein
MTEVNIVTSFNENLLKNTTHYLLTSLQENLDPKIKFTGYHHDCKLDAYVVPDTFTYKDLHEVKEHEDFAKRFSAHDGTEEGTLPYNEKIDALKWSHKVFALTAEAFSLVEKDSSAGWLVWLDADTYLHKRFTKDDILFMLPEGADIVFNPDDPFFVAFNLNKQSTVDLLSDLRGAYILGEVTKYREWHDSYVLQRLLNIYQAHGMRVHNTNQMHDYFYHFKGTPDFTKLAVRNSKGERIFPLSEETTPDIKPNRYQQIGELMDTYKPKSVIETGTWNGGRAIQMALTAFEYSDNFTYKGYDLFEDATIETDHEEFNSKAHNTMVAVQKRLEEFAEHVKVNRNKTFTFELQKGNTRKTLVDQGEWYDMALVGGGNSIETVAHDFHCVKKTPVIVLDHYFREDDEKLLPNDAYQGVNKIFESFKKNKKVRKHVLPSGDRVKGGGFTHLMVILNDKKLPNIPEHLQRVPIVVNPRDCVPKDYIRNNIRENLKLIPDNKFITKYRNHGDHAIIVSGGHSTDFNKVKEILNENPDTLVMCVKHAYPHLLKNGIKPWGCIVLDPRSIDGESTHGIKRKDLFKTIEPSTKFFIATMTDPSVTNYLMERKADIWGWNAFTESLRDDEDRKQGIQNNQVKIRDDIGLPKGATLITGGTCAAMRAIGMLHTMGFRTVHLFGFDCNLKEEPTEEMKKETTGAEDEDPRPKYFQVSVDKDPYWTTGELLAMAQDCERTFKDDGMGINFIFHGEKTLVGELWKKAKELETLPNYKEFFNAQ